MMIKKETRSIYEAPQVEELILQFEECILSNDPQKGGGERLLDEEQAGF